MSWCALFPHERHSGCAPVRWTGTRRTPAVLSLARHRRLAASSDSTNEGSASRRARQYGRIEGRCTLGAPGAVGRVRERGGHVGGVRAPPRSLITTSSSLCSNRFLARSGAGFWWCAPQHGLGPSAQRSTHSLAPLHTMRPYRPLFGQVPPSASELTLCSALRCACCSRRAFGSGLGWQPGGEHMDAASVTWFLLRDGLSFLRPACSHAASRRCRQRCLCAPGD